MKQIYTICFLVLFICSVKQGFAQTLTISGTVLNHNKKPIDHAIVLLNPLNKVAATDANGHFSFLNLSSGTYAIKVMDENSPTITYKDFSLVKDTVFRVVLEDNIIEHQEIIVTGTSIATERRISPTPIHAIGFKAMLEQSSLNIIDAISKVPGVNQVTTGPSISKPIIRGLGYNRIITLQDGVRQEGQQWGDEHGIEIDEYHVQKVEVLKMPSSLSYGSDALGGVINILTEPTQSKEGISGTLLTNMQTNNGLFSSHANIAFAKKTLRAGFYITSKSAHDYKNAFDGYVCNSRFENLNFGGHLGIEKKWGSSKLYFSSFTQTLGLIEGERDEQTGAFIYPAVVNGQDSFLTYDKAQYKEYSFLVPKQIIMHKKVSWNNQIVLPNSAKINAIIAYQNNQRKEYAVASAPDQADLHLTLHTLTSTLSYLLPTYKDWNLSFGWNAMYQKNIIQGDDLLIPNYTILDNGVYAMFQRKKDKFFVSGGIRFDSRIFKTEALWLDTNFAIANQVEDKFYEQFREDQLRFSRVTGSIGMSYKLTNDLYVKINFANAFRSPNIAELSANGVHEGTIRYEYGNVNLKPENATQLDFGVDYKSKHINIQASVFTNRIQNFIYLSKMLTLSGADSIPVLRNENQFTAFQHTQNLAHLYGAEFYVDVHPHPINQLHFELTTSYVRAIGKTDNGTNFDLPQIPPFRSLIATKYEWKNLTNKKLTAYFKAELDYNSQQNNYLTLNNSETATPSYSLFNLYAGIDLFEHTSKLLLAANNIFDIAYQSNTNRLKYAAQNVVSGRNGVFNMGRNISFTFVYNF